MKLSNQTSSVSLSYRISVTTVTRADKIIFLSEFMAYY